MLRFGAGSGVWIVLLVLVVRAVVLIVLDDVFICERWALAGGVRVGKGCILSKRRTEAFPKALTCSYWIKLLSRK